MIKELQDALNSNLTLIVSAYLGGGDSYTRRGVYAVDSVGVVIESRPGEEIDKIAIPWTSINHLDVEVG